MTQGCGVNNKIVIVGKGTAVGSTIIDNTEENRERAIKAFEKLAAPCFNARAETRKVQEQAKGTRAAIMDPLTKGRYRNQPCACGSGIKNKKCCGKGS